MIIYKITNKINGKIYIGQTRRTLEERMKNYREECKFAKKVRPIILAMRKYGFDNFSFSVIKDNISSQEELDYLERYYIKYFNSQINSGFGYNVELGGNSEGKHSVETKRKISQAQIGELNHMYGKTGSLNKTSKPVIELTSGIQYDSANIAAKELGLSFSHVCAVARGERGSTGGYVFRYIDKKSGKPIELSSKTKIKSKIVLNNILPKYNYLV